MQRGVGQGETVTPGFLVLQLCLLVSPSPLNQGGKVVWVIAILHGSSCELFTPLRTVCDSKYKWTPSVFFGGPHSLRAREA